MAYLPVELPPGIYRNGTERQSKGRWYDGHLIRFFENQRKPHGGWAVHSTSTMTGKGRRIMTWTDNSSPPVRWCAVGTSSHLYIMASSGTISDITPAGFTAGSDDATVGGGYGHGNYGAGAYGVPGSDTSAIQDCTVWSLDTYGQYLVGCTVDDGYLYEWTLNVASAAVKLTTDSPPTANRALVMTPERFLFVLGAGGVPRRVQWPDQASLVVWTPSTTNQAGSFDLQSVGRLMQGKRVTGATLLFTDVDVHLATYIGGTLIYGFKQVGAPGSGVVSQNCVGEFDGNAVWMGRNGFWLYNGFVQPLPCEVHDYVFGSINLQQISKVTVHTDSYFGEVTWHYPSVSSTENDRYVTWSYRAYERGQNVWTYGTYARTAGCDRGAFVNPLRVGTDNNVYDHEIGFSYSGADSPYLESGPIELGEGDQVFHVTQMIPDDATIGDVTATFKVKFYPDAAETVFGPYTLSSPTDLRFTGRQAKIRFTGAAMDDWRIGNFRLEARAGGRR